MGTPAISGEKTFYAHNSYEIKDILKARGWRWAPGDKVWWTQDVDALASALDDLLSYGEAVSLTRLADAAIAELPEKTRERVCAELAPERAERIRAMVQASTVDEDAPIPVPEGLSLLPFQVEGVRHLLAHKRTLLADEQGLGKTIQVLALVNADDTIRRALIVCPPSVTGVWRAEASRWLTRPLTVEVATAKEWPESDLVIVHWAIVERHAQAIRQREWDLVVLDEAHWAKNPKAKRTRAIVGSRDLEPLVARRQLALSGTPIPNKPVELQAIARWLWPEKSWTQWKRFVETYCDGYQDRFGWRVDGSSNLGELREHLLHAGMLRRRKDEVLSDLPAKLHRLVPLDASVGDIRAALKAEQKEIKELKEKMRAARKEVQKARQRGEEAAYKRATAELRACVVRGLAGIARVRHETALAKAPIVAEHTLSALEEGEEKLIVFVWHRDVAQVISDALAREGVGHVVMTGETPLGERAAMVERFQTDADVRVFIGSIAVASEGITLTAASHVIFAELDWTPGRVAQAEDRAHRIGQHDSVLVEHVVVDGSIDARIAQVLMKKAEVAATVLGDAPVSEGPEPDALAAVLEFGDEAEELEMLLATDEVLVA